MPRAKKNIHGSPATAGDNMAEYTDKHKGTDPSAGMVYPIYNIGQGNRENYKGQYDEPTLKKCVDEFFSYCAKNDIKPSKSGLQLWLGIDRSTYNRWENGEDGFKRNIVNQANKFMEFCYVQRGESTPTFNMFLLKAAHGMVEPQKIEITSQNNVSKEDVADAISKLGLDEED